MSGGRGASDPPVTFQGAYDASRTYLPRQMVTSGGAMYMAVARTLGHAPSTSEVTPWQPLGGTPAGSTIQSTVGPGLPAFAGHNPGDLHFNETDHKEYTLTGVPGPSVTDGFSRPDGNVTGTTTEGGGLTYASNTFGGSSSIVSQQVAFGTSLSGNTIPVGPGAQEIGADVVFPASGASDEAHLLVRCAPDGSGGYDLSLENGRIKIGKGNIAGSALLVTIDSGLRSVSARYSLKVDASLTSPTITAYKNGVAIGGYTDSSSPGTGSSVGFGGISTVTHTVTLDNLTAFNAGTLAWTPSLGRNAENVGLITTTGSTVTIPSPEAQAITKVLLNGNAPMALPAPIAGQSFRVLIAQDTVGGRTVTWPAGPAVLWPGAVVPTQTPTASKSDLYEFVAVDSTSWLGRVVGQNY